MHRFIEYEELRRHASSFIEKYHPSRKIPIPIERIIEVQLGMDIIPIPNLRNNYDSEGFLASDFSSIYVDEKKQKYHESRYFFTLAHEIAHLILHREIYENADVNSAAEWFKFLHEIDANNFKSFEYQANTLAGLILVPEDKLRVNYEQVVSKMQKTMIAAGQSLLEIKEDNANEYVAKEIKKKFMVSEVTAKIRIREDKLSPKDFI